MKNMKKKKMQITFNVISICLIVAFIVKTIINYYQYNEMINSAPFYVWIIINALCLLLPALIIFIIGYINIKKINK